MYTAGAACPPPTRGGREEGDGVRKQRARWLGLSGGQPGGEGVAVGTGGWACQPGEFRHDKKKFMGMERRDKGRRQQKLEEKLSLSLED